MRTQLKLMSKARHGDFRITTHLHQIEYRERNVQQGYSPTLRVVLGHVTNRFRTSAHGVKKLGGKWTSK